MKKGMRATSVKKFLIVVIVLFLAAAAGGFYLGLQYIKSYSIEVSHTVADSNASADKVETLRSLKQYLADSENLVNKANQLFSTEADYQPRALSDLQRYAAATGVAIANTSFGDASTGVEKGHTVVLSLASPVSYDGLLRFLDAIEGNLPKMQVSNISISRPSTGNAGQVEIEDVKIVISTR